MMAARVVWGRWKSSGVRNSSVTITASDVTADENPVRAPLAG